MQSIDRGVNMDKQPRVPQDSCVAEGWDTDEVMEGKVILRDSGSGPGLRTTALPFAVRLPATSIEELDRKIGGCAASCGLAGRVGLSTEVEGRLRFFGLGGG